MRFGKKRRGKEKERNERRFRLLITLRSYKMLFTGLRILVWGMDLVMAILCTVTMDIPIDYA